jgi:hypothetical protein
MGEIKPTWVKFKDMGGPRYLGEKDSSGNYLHVYNPPKPWGVWSQILGVVARSEGRHDTVVMYDETGVTAGAFQWTFKSGRLQKLIQSFKGVPYFDFSSENDSTLFDVYLVKQDGLQIFEEFDFKIEGGSFCAKNGKSFSANSETDRQIIVDTCMGRRSLLNPPQQKEFALGLCALVAGLFQKPEIQAASIEYAKMEFKLALNYNRPPLEDVGGQIRCLLPEPVWGSPIPAIFFNLFQNSPGGAFQLFINAMTAAQGKGLAKLKSDGYVLGGGSNVIDDILIIIWKRLNATKYADWGFGSKQYIESGGKNPPRIMNIQPAIKEFYGIDLPYFK